MTKRLFLQLSTVALLHLSLPAQDAVQPKAGDLYGVVEVGASGVKAVVIQMNPADADPESPPVTVRKQYEPLDWNAVFKESATEGRIAKAVTMRHKEMKDEFQLEDSHFFLVGSSGLPADVKSTISATTFSEGTIEYITPEKEATLVFRGIVPQKRFNQVIVLDVGSGNAKGAYVEKAGPKPEFATFAVAMGTKTFAEKITEAKGEGQFIAAASRLRTELLLPKVQNAVRDYPGLQNRRRIYLAGGITWVMASYLHPEQIGPDKKGKEGAWVKLSTKDVREFYSTATADPSFLLKPSMAAVRPENREKVEAEFARISKTFNPDQLMAGALILKTFMDEMNFDKKDAIFFSRRALYAWPQGYVLEKISTPKQ